MRKEYLLILLILLTREVTPRSWLQQWIDENLHKGFLGEISEVIGILSPRSTERLPPQPPFPPPDVVTPQPHAPITDPIPVSNGADPFSPSVIPKAPTQSPDLTQTTTTKAVSTTTQKAEAETTTPKIVVSPTNNKPPETDSDSETSIRQLKSLIMSKWSILSLILLLSAVLFISGFLIYYCRRKQHVLLPEEPKEYALPTIAIVNTSYFNRPEHIDALKYVFSYEVDKSNMEIGEKLGQGHYGVVFDGILKIDEQWNNLISSDLNSSDSPINNRRQKVAVKAIGEASTPEEIALRKKMLNDELKLMCGVGSHPNIVTLLGAVTKGKETLIIMDMCSVGNLQKFLKSKKLNFIPQFQKLKSELADIDSSYSVSSTASSTNYKKLESDGTWETDLSKNITTAHLLSFSMQIANGMDYLTSMKNCIHRDLAARNILLTAEGLCKIADFGLAKRVGYKEYYRTKTVPALPRRWMAIESLKEDIFTVKSDIWSYGIVLYEIFSLGLNPYPILEGDPTEAIIRGARNDQPEYCPDAIFCHMKRCWSTDLNHRPSFRDSANLMKKHLLEASEEVLSKVEEELRLEENKQKEFSALRIAAQKTS